MSLPNFIENEPTFDKKSYFKNKRFLHYEFALFLFNRHSGCLLDGIPHVFTGKKYEPVDKYTIRSLTMNYIPTLTENQNKEVYFKLDALCRDNECEQADARYIGVKNGVYDVVDKKLHNFSPDFRITNVINAQYVPNATSDEVDNFIKDLSNDDQEVYQLIIEMIGYGLFRDNFLQVAFFFYSPGSNGKSSLFKLLHRFYGQYNTTALTLEDLNSRFKPSSLKGSLVNIADDINANFLKDTGNYKTIVTGDTLNVERKGQDDFSFTPYVKLMFAGNELPHTSDKSDGFYRRMVIIPMFRKFGTNGHKKDPRIISKLTTDYNLSALLNLAINGLENLLDKGEIIIPQVAKETKEQYEYENDPVLQFIHEADNDLYRQLPVIEGRPTTTTYTIYQEWCYKNGYKPYSKAKLTRDLTRLGYKVKVKIRPQSRKTVKVYYLENKTTVFYDEQGDNF
ncbi:putative phage primase [Staphylococcus equorum subsp. equorum Mu2]|nr:DNA primase family protein [Staphylococcus equorum]CCI60785.1 putative phage primase [Staphylococcus equorum subsp. equorum Mu2]